MLNSWFIFRLDYVTVWYGAAFLLLSIIAFMLHSNQRSNSKTFLYWNKFGWFAALYGFSTWICDLYISFRDIPLLNYSHFIFSIVSFYFLYRFAFDSSKYQDVNSLFSKSFASVFSFLGIISIFHNFNYFVFFIMLAFAIPAVIQSISLFKNLSKKIDNNQELRYSAVFMGVFYSLNFFLLGKVFLFQDFYTRINSDFNNIFAILFYIMFIFAALFIFFIWHYAKIIIKEQSVIFKGYYLPIASILLFFACLGLVEWRTDSVNSDVRSYLLRMTTGLSRTLSAQRLDDLTYSSQDSDSPVYNSICRQLRIFQQSQKSVISYIYFLAKKDGKYYFGPQSELNINKNYVLPGTAYDYNNKVLDSVYETGKPVVYGPYTDNFGEYITAYFPIYKISNQTEIAYIVGVDTDSEKWKITLERTRAYIFIDLMALLGFPYICFTILIIVNKNSDIRTYDSLPYLTFGYGLICSVLLALFVNTIDIEKNKFEFWGLADSNAMYVGEYFKKMRSDIEWVENYLDLKKGFANYEDFILFAKIFANDIERRFCKWLAVVKGDELVSFENKVRQEKGFENFKITEFRSVTSKPAVRPADKYVPILYSYPEDEHNNTVGCDYLSEKNRSIVLRDIIRTGLPSAIFPTDFSLRYLQSCLFVLIPIKNKINNNIENIFVHVMPLQDLIDKIMASRTHFKDEIEFELVDLEQEKAVSILAAYPNNNNHKLTDNRFEVSYPLFLFDRTVVLNCRPNLSYYKYHFNNYYFYFVFIAGILFTGFIVLFVTFLQHRQSDLEKLVNERTQEVFKQENLIKTISDNLPIVSYRCTADDEHRFTFLSSEIINIIGVAPSDFLVGNRSYYDFIHPNDIEYVKKSISEASKNRQHFDIEYRVSGRNKEILWVNERGHMAFDQEGKPLWIDGTIADVTARREAAAKLNESLYELEKANAELKLQTEMANQFAEEARIADEAKSMFLANMSHEIRTPMNAIIGMSGLLKETEQTQIQRKYTDIICSSSENLLALINDILDFSKMEAGKMHFENINFKLSDCVDDVVKMLAIRAAQKNLKLRSKIEGDVPLLLKGDPYRLRQVIINLVSNAIKFTEIGSVDIHVSLGERYGEDVLLKFVVADTGIGIEKKDIGRLFNVFVQADGSTARKYGGTGLGLAISKQIVEHFNGKIGVESEFGKGSEFWFTSRFSIADENEVYSEEDNQASDDSSKPTSVIADCLKNIDSSVMDREDLTQRLLKDEDLIKKIINTFNNVVPGIIETLRFAIEAENNELAKQQAHKLKGSAVTISAFELEKESTELENYLIKGENNQASECFQRLENAYNKLKKELFHAEGI